MYWGGSTKPAFVTPNVTEICALSQKCPVYQTGHLFHRYHENVCRNFVLTDQLYCYVSISFLFLMKSAGKSRIFDVAALLESPFRLQKRWDQLCPNTWFPTSSLDMDVWAVPFNLSIKRFRRMVLSISNPRSIHFEKSITSPSSTAFP